MGSRPAGRLRVFLIKRATPYTWSLVAAAIMVVASLATSADAAGGSFYEDFEVVWGEDPHPERRVAVIDGGRLVKLTLDNVSGSGFQSKDAFLFGEFTMQMKLVPGDSAGTVTTFYLSSKDYPMWEGDGHDEIDFEFLGNVSGEPYLMQTNVYAQGGGRREQRFFLWFDPTADFHNYTILWNPLNIIFSVDGVPVRVFKNHELQGVPYLSTQAMKARASIWDGESWVTMGGRVKTDWSHAPFVASYGAYDASTACVSSSSCSAAAAPWMTRRLGPEGQRALAWARDNYMVMDYCDDPWKVFPRGVPAECGIDRLAMASLL
ncbi:putative xyloglucan endotransglucosylase/hydrolase protein 13 isoform X2 [Brachypodium distachyon]|uniref:putative xyloglucan endotransglucosylase/hydrolase protein 13 isoform X2 n=1 Tax=Brachypodium distachyon TaxID=15368 RepID=UPI000D0DCEB0|nr:putative xyloglucan endotransglucosylase/hydrolase protein 13 isoform X2 [Brachypodium distachyon]|eukprot:XP_024312042.1 putative xyloglucan endotransglucosylase/hydrolase protein 13 isoform X2 [Brachypodium distachyon]